MRTNGLVRKQFGQRRRRYRKRGGLIRLQRGPNTFFGGKINSFRAEIAAPVFIYSSTGPSYVYSFSNVNNLNIMSVWNVMTVAYASDIINMFNSYMYYRIKGVKLSFTRSINSSANAVHQLPALYVDLIQDSNATNNTYMSSNRWAAESDTSLEILPLSTESAPQTRYYSMGNGVFNTSTNVYGGGKGGWISTNNQPNYQLVLGFLDVPTLSAVGENPKIGSVTVLFYFDFCKRGRINNF